ncbi:FAD:protein FMN transferase [Paracoccus marinaquae]|uniref:FAD:protein FMN transferase n=1 Tax=Paracoccus marinaquae TaxID=2841926 RepID=A0ABS6AF24_9RHOB|nr:FAD:protein FMN transferase [Paracoccus marinaquae]MBU3028707.1 FAD:protein FMN transferase [Paracoccus marinaquae]
MNRRRFLILTACAAALPRAGLAATDEWRSRAMGADVTLRLQGASAVQARAFFAEAARVLAHVESLFSLHRASDLQRLNRIGGLRFPADGMIELLALSDRLHRITGGVFDPTIQPLWLARAGGTDESRAVTGWQGVSWSDREVSLARPGMALTFNGIAQGWAADQLAAAAARHDLTDLLIDTGEVRALGSHGWRAELADARGRVHQRLILSARALATSSPSATRIGPRQMPHIMAHDDRPPLWDTISVSAPQAALADGLSTALCLMTPEEAVRAMAQLPECRIELQIPAGVPG